MIELPTPSALGLPPGAVVAVPPGGLTVYRLVGGPRPAESDFLPTPERRARAVGYAEILRLGLSHFLTVEQAVGAMRRAGSRIAAVALPDDIGAHLARTGRTPGHVTVWAPREELLARARVVA